MNKLIKLYEQGVITEHELLWRLSDETKSDEKLPDEWQKKVDELLAYRAANSDKIFRTFSITA